MSIILNEYVDLRGKTEVEGECIYANYVPGGRTNGFYISSNYLEILTLSGCN
jgi:hypothetical protein